MVSKLFDTSVLFAASLNQHVRYAWASTRVDEVAAGVVRGVLCAHALAELYATFTVHPQSKLSPSRAIAFLERFTQVFEVIPLELSDYQASLARVERLGLVSGAIYDVLHAQACLKAGCDALVTLNTKHFLRLGEDLSGKIEAPP